MTENENQRLKDALAILDIGKKIKNEHDWDTLVEKTAMILEFREKYQCRYQGVIDEAARKWAEVEPLIYGLFENMQSGTDTVINVETFKLLEQIAKITAREA